MTVIGIDDHFDRISDVVELFFPEGGFGSFGVWIHVGGGIGVLNPIEPAA